MKGPFPLTADEAERDEHGHGPWTRDLVRELAELAHAEGEHRVACYVEKDLHEGKARYYRADTLVWVYTRDLENWERQQPLTFETGPATNTASEAAKVKSPGLNDAPEEPPAPAPPADAPDEIRAAVIEAGVPDSMIDAAIRAIRDGGDPERVIANAKRAVAEKPAKEPKTKAGKKGKAKLTPEEQERADLLKELRTKLGQNIGTDAAFAVADGRMDRAQAIAVGEELKGVLEADDEFDGHHTSILEDVFTECLSVDDAIHNARLRIAKVAEAKEAAQ